MTTDPEKRRAKERRKMERIKADPERLARYREKRRRLDRKRLQDPVARARHYARAELRRAERLEFSRKLRDRPCLDCGGRFPVECMEFDHLPQYEKLFGVGSGLTRSWSAIVAEIDKCEVVCANCHRIRTARRRGAKRGSEEKVGGA